MPISRFFKHFAISGKDPAGDLAGGHFGGHGVRNFWNRGLLRFVALRVGGTPALAAALRPDRLPAAKMLTPVLQLDGTQNEKTPLNDWGVGAPCKIIERRFSNFDQGWRPGMRILDARPRRMENPSRKVHWRAPRSIIERRFFTRATAQQEMHPGPSSRTMESRVASM